MIRKIRFGMLIDVQHDRLVSMHVRKRYRSIDSDTCRRLRGTSLCRDLHVQWLAGSKS